VQTQIRISATSTPAAAKVETTSSGAGSIKVALWVVFATVVMLVPFDSVMQVAVRAADPMSHRTDDLRLSDRP
jgi:hypothetical protein